MRILKQLFFISSILLMLNACTKEDELPKETKLTLNLTTPEGVSITEYKKVKVIFTEINTGLKTEKEVTQNNVTITLLQGSYEVIVDGEIVYTFKGATLKGGVSANENNLQLVQDVVNKTMKVSLKSLQKDFLIEEIFFTGTLTPKGKQYSGDKYFKIYNNTSETLYADGLLIAESAFLTIDKQEYTPNVMEDAFTATSIIQIPGSNGDTKYPVKPGEFIIVALDAINHKENNSNSFDLSTANFEVYNKSMDDVDNPAVPNTINLYEKMIIHNRGFKSYVIARLPKDTSTEMFLQKNKYTYKWIFEFNGMSFPMDGEGCKIPNNLILDAVNLSVESEFKWIVTDPSLDNGWTYCGKVDHDKSRYGKSVRRKVVQTIDGRRLLQDTNNSTIDFEAEVTPSLSK